MLKTIRNWTAVVLFFGLCLTGFLGPVLWPELYAHQYALPLVQHHVELCDKEVIYGLQFCEPIDPFEIA